jgi:hypothetical protein
MIERYALGRLPEAAEEALEEHLFVCDYCMDRLALESVDISALKIALRRANDKKAWWERFPSLHIPKPIWVTAPAALLLLAAVAPVVYRYSIETPFAVELHAYRSDSGGIVAPHGRGLNLRLSAEGLTEGPGWTAHIVNSAGTEIQTGTLEVKGAATAFKVSEGLPRGDYWVQLMAPHDPDHPVREYQLSVR